MGYAWAASDSTESERVREHLARLQRAADGALVLVNSLTVVAGDPTGSAPRCEVGLELRDLVALVRPSVHAPAELLAELDEPAPARIAPGDLRQLVLNLVLNAAQAIEGSPGTIRVRARREGDEVTIEVADDGPGIPEDLVERVFESRFTTRTEGTGHGLATVRELVERTGGRIELHRVEPHGARFLVHLPAAD